MLRGVLRRENPTYTYWSLQWGVVLKWFYGPPLQRRVVLQRFYLLRQWAVETPLSEVHALHRVPFYSFDWFAMDGAPPVLLNRAPTFVNPAVITRMHVSAIRCVRNHEQSIRKNGKFDPPPVSTKWLQIMQTPPRIYDYVAELSCCAKFEQNRLTKFCWENGGSLSFFTHTHNQTNSFISPKDHKYGRIWNIYG